MSLFDNTTDVRAVALLDDGWTTTPWCGIVAWLSPEGNKFTTLELAIEEQARRIGKVDADAQ